MTTTKRLALKEWHTIISAVCHDRAQTVLFRKGGILDTRFASNLHQDLTYFFPTSFHTNPGMLKPDWASRVEIQDVRSLKAIPVDSAFRITGAWHCTEPRIGEILDDFHVYGPTFLETRLGYRKQEPLCVLEVEPFRLCEPLMLENTEGLWGCFSWIDLAQVYPTQEFPPISTSLRFCVPVLEDFSQRQEKLRERLELMTDGVTTIL